MYAVLTRILRIIDGFIRIVGNPDNSVSFLCNFYIYNADGERYPMTVWILPSGRHEPLL